MVLFLMKLPCDSLKQFLLLTMKNIVKEIPFILMIKIANEFLKISSRISKYLFNSYSTGGKFS